MKKKTNKRISSTAMLKFLKDKTNEEKREILLNYFYKKEYIKKKDLH
jgi:hypothetical protein